MIVDDFVAIARNHARLFPTQPVQPKPVDDHIPDDLPPEWSDLGPLDENDIADLLAAWPRFAILSTIEDC